MNLKLATRELISAIQHLHDRERPICHGRLSLQTISLKLDVASERYSVRVDDFHEAKTQAKYVPRVVPYSGHDQALRVDLEAMAQIMFALFTKREATQMLGMEDLQNFPDFEIGILILALQRGMSAIEALQTAPFHTAEEKKSILSELNAKLKKEKAWRCNSNQLEAAE